MRGDMTLAKNAILCFPGGEAGRELYCIDGLLWVTRSGDSIDHLLRAGDRFPLDAPGRVVVEPLVRSTVSVSARSSSAA